MKNNYSMTYVLLGFCAVMAASYLGSRIKQKFSANETNDEYKLIKQYLLNDSVLYGKNRPKLWIHSSYELNARKWKNYMSRTSTDLNQPYLYLTIQSIINHCGDDFHICLIDDDSFEKLIPGWTTVVQNIADPMRSRYRQLGLMQLLYIYGGMVVPNSFLCTKNLIDVYRQGVQNKTPFIAETISKSFTKDRFLPNILFMGSKKEDGVIQNLIHKLEESHINFSKEQEFLGIISLWCSEQIENKNMQLLDGKLVGVKTNIEKPVLLEHLLSDDYIDYDDSLLHGILIPQHELLKRPKYQWYSILPVDDVLEADCILSKYFKTSMVNNPVDKFYKTRSENTSMVAI